MIVRFLAFFFKPVFDELYRQHEEEVDERAIAIAQGLRDRRLARQLGSDND